MVGGRIAGTLVAAATLIVLGFVALGLFTSLGGLSKSPTLATGGDHVGGAVPSHEGEIRIVQVEARETATSAEAQCDLDRRPRLKD